MRTLLPLSSYRARPWRLFHGVIVSLAVVAVFLVGSAQTKAWSSDMTDIIKIGGCTHDGTCTFFGYVTTTRSFGVLWTPQESVNVCGIKLKVTRASSNPASQEDLNERLEVNVFRHASYGDLDGSFPYAQADQLQHFIINGAEIPYNGQYQDTLIPWTTISSGSVSNNCWAAQKGDTMSVIVDQVASGAYMIWGNSNPTPAYSYLTPWYTDNDVTWTLVGASPIQQYIWLFSPSDFITNSSYFGFPASSTYDFENVPPASSSWIGEILYPIGRFFSDIMQYLFVPSTAVTGQWDDVKTSLNLRAPFSYFNEISDMFSDAAASSSAFPAFSVDLTPYGIHASPTLFSLQAVQTYMPAGLLTVFQLLMITSLWLALAFHMFHTIKSLI
jgi:hypothetical protein